MRSLIHVVMSGAVLIAFIAWATAAFMTLDVVNLALTDEKRATCLQLGMARFASLEALLGPQVKPYLLHYKRAFFVCFAVIAAIVALSFLIPLLKTA